MIEIIYTIGVYAGELALVGGTFLAVHTLIHHFRRR